MRRAATLNKRIRARAKESNCKEQINGKMGKRRQSVGISRSIATVFAREAETKLRNTTRARE